MKEGPALAPLAALIGDPARANMLGALMSGLALTASELARTSLIEVDGIIVGKTSKRPIAQFLLRHGRLEAAEIPIVIESLKRVLAEVRKN